MTLIPVILFTYARPEHLQRTLESLRLNKVPLLYVFSDGPRTATDEPDVAAVRQMLRDIDWCEVILVERETNLGLGRSILRGVSTVLKEYDTVIVFEDDLICVPGTYDYLCTALQYYRNEPKVMSVTGWTHPCTTPSNVSSQPYFDGRAECWTWGTWARAWRGMEYTALELMRACKQRGIDPFRYGADLPAMAKIEIERNIWAVRWLYLHILNQGLCLRPPHSMVEHIGFDARATNTSNGEFWANPPLQVCPPLPAIWPEPVEHPECGRLWQVACGGRPGHPLITRLLNRAVHIFQRVWHLAVTHTRGDV